MLSLKPLSVCVGIKLVVSADLCRPVLVYLRTETWWYAAAGNQISRTQAQVETFSSRVFLRHFWTHLTFIGSHFGEQSLGDLRPLHLLLDLFVDP